MVGKVFVRWRFKHPRWIPFRDFRDDFHRRFPAGKIGHVQNISDEERLIHVLVPWHEQDVVSWWWIDYLSGHGMGAILPRSRGKVN